MKKLKNQKGITLVALVITIIILIILAGISISIVLGEDGLIAKSKKGAEAYQTAATNEQQLLDNINAFIDGKIDTISSGNGGTSGGSQTTAPIIKSAGNVAISDYGQYVDIGTNILDRTIEFDDGTTPASDWRIFKKESNGIWLILTDYLPNASFDVTTVGLVACTGDKALYGIKANSQRGNLINGLNNSNWSNLITGSSLTGVSGVQVKGAFELEEWIGSWEDRGYIHLNTNIKNGVSSSNPTWGYYAYKDGESNTSTKTNLDTTDTLYYPNRPGVISYYGWGYKLASPSAVGYTSVMTVWGGGEFGDGDYREETTCLRPAVFIPSSVNFNATNSVWTIAE